MRISLHEATSVLEKANKIAIDKNRPPPFPEDKVKSVLVDTVLSRGQRPGDENDELQLPEDFPIVWHTAPSNKFKLRCRHVAVAINHDMSLPLRNMAPREETESPWLTSAMALTKTRDNFWTDCVTSSCRKTGRIATANRILLQLIKEHKEVNGKETLYDWMTSEDVTASVFNIQPFYGDAQSLKGAIKNAHKLNRINDTASAHPPYQFVPDEALEREITEALDSNDAHHIREAAWKGMTPLLHEKLVQWRKAYLVWREEVEQDETITKEDKTAIQTSRQKFLRFLEFGDVEI